MRDKIFCMKIALHGSYISIDCIVSFAYYRTSCLNTGKV